MIDLDALDFEKGGGLVTVVAQDAISGAVLMVAHADRAALERTVDTGEMHYHSRSRGRWHKGETSGNTQRVVSLTADCDGDAVLARVVPAGPACHTGLVSCFGEPALSADAIGELSATIARRGNDLEAQAYSTPSYTQRLLQDQNLRLKKLGEEVAELVVACSERDSVRAADEGGDLLYHMLVALHAVGVTWSDLQRLLAERAGRASNQSKAPARPSAEERVR